MSGTRGKDTGPVILAYRNHLPIIAEEAFVAPNATVIGDVEIGGRSSLWFGVVVRGDVNHIRIGERSNLQDGTIVHVSGAGWPTLIGSDVTVGHLAIIHACTLEDRSFVGMGACVMDGAIVESGAMVAAGALITPGKRVKSGELWSGRPGKLMRALTDAECAMMAETAAHYARLADEYRLAGRRR